MTFNFSSLKSLKNKIFFFFVVLLLLVQSVAFFTITQAIKSQEEQRFKSELSSASTIFQTIFSTSQLTLNNFNQISNKILAENFTDDIRSFLVALENFRNRVDADLAMSIDRSGVIKAQIIRHTLSNNRSVKRIGSQQGEMFSGDIEWLSRSETFKFYRIQNDVYQLSVSEVRVGSEIIGWIALGNRIDHDLANEFYRLDGFHIKFLLSNSESCSLIASSNKVEHTKIKPLDCPDELENFEYGQPIILGQQGDKIVSVVLYGSRDDLLSTIQQRWLILSALASFTLLLSLLGAYLIAASISRPVRQLVIQAKYIAEGHYDKSVVIEDSGEFGQLANEFNLMKKAVIEREKRILHNSSHDPITDLPNRSRLLHTLEKWLKHSGIEHAIFLIKINHINEINESLGHEIGDKVIKVVGKRLETIEHVDLLSHLRSDEFVLLVNDISKSSVLRWIDQITQVMEIPYSTKGMTLHLQTHIGVALSQRSERSPSNFLRMADSALQLARKEKQVFKLYDQSQDNDQAERLSLMNDLHLAITDNQLRLFYQPKLELATGKIAHVEALIRWFHPEKGMIPPDKFIPIAENTGQIDLLTQWVLEEAARQYSEWRKDNIKISIAINVSAQNLNSDKIYNSVQFILEQYKLDVTALQLEVTESAVVENPVTAIALLAKFKEAGIRLSIDDYGTGYSSLAQLKQLPVHELKIDMSFITRLPDDEDDKIIVKSTIELAHNMGLSVVAEGVETEAALQWLSQQGCEFIQGYYINKPLPADEFIAWLKQSEYY